MWRWNREDEGELGPDFEFELQNRAAVRSQIPTDSATLEKARHAQRLLWPKWPSSPKTSGGKCEAVDPPLR